MNLKACHFCGKNSYCSCCKIVINYEEEFCDICKPLSIESKYDLVDQSNYELLNNLIK